MTNVIDDRSFQPLRDAVSGAVITPDQADYDEARTIFNAMINRRPGVIVQCQSPDDVAAAIRFAREQQIEVAVRGGGHSVGGNALTDGGLVIDLRRMNQATVNPGARTVTLGGGATMADLDRACEPHGLATTGGRVSTTGVGGFVLGGGSGWLDRKFGLACDNLVSVDLITADGSRVTASDQENPELFWALHGGGGNFGVATELTLRLHPLPIATFGMLLWSPERGPEITRIYRDLIENGPDELGGGLIYHTGFSPDDAPFAPAYLTDRLSLLVVVMYAGTSEDARRAIAPLLDTRPEGLLLSEMPYSEAQSAIDDPPGFRNYWSAEHLDSLPDEAVDVFCARAESMIVPSASQHVLFPAGGVAGRGRSDYPLPWRSSPWVVHPFGLWTDPADDERGVQWTRDVRADVQLWASGAVYLNFIADEGDDRLVAGLGEENYRRLAAVKAEYDPDNVFHLNHNIRPGTPAPSP
jgi:FAD/FMN-containing dehydrogenase